METSLTVVNHQLPRITSKLNPEEEYFLQIDTVYTIKQYADLKLKDPNSQYVGEDLARYHIGNALLKMYEMIGLPKESHPDKEAARTIARYIQRTFPFITPREIVDSVEFALQEKFPIKRKDGTTLLDHFRSMNLKFISEFLHTYVKWRYEKKQKLLDKIDSDKAPAYHVICEMMLRDDAAVKGAIKEAFEVYKRAENGKYEHLQYLRDIWFTFMVDVGLVKYNRDELNQKYRDLLARNAKMTKTEAMNACRVYAIGQAFEELRMEQNPFEIFERVSYFSWNILYSLHGPWKKHAS